ncbi:MAG: TolC family protein, partial [Sulfurovum sp.]|nr:TolC family protein [Sulfurovum sp.]
YKNYKSFKQNYQDFVKLYKKKQKAYKYQEISKAELMQLEIEKNRLDAQLHEIQMIQKISKEKVLTLGRINHSEKTVLVCNDMYPIRENVKLKEDTFQLSKKAHEKRIKSTQAALERHSKALDSISLSVQYDKEIDMDRYSIGVSIPLAFTSQRSEQERAAALHHNSAISFNHEQTMLEKKSMFSEMKNTLKSKAMIIRSLKKNLYDYKKNLLPLIKKSYELGESSVIEYLLNRQNYYQLKQELFATKKAYYHTLFTLYTFSEMKDN